MKKDDPRNKAVYLDEFVLPGVSRWQLKQPVVAVCDVQEPHFIKVTEVFKSVKKKGIFAFCKAHADFFNIEMLEK